MRLAVGAARPRAHLQCSERFTCCIPLHTHKIKPTGPPQPVDDTYPQPAKGPLTIPKPGVRDNDTIPCGAQAVLTVTVPPMHGSVSLTSNGGFLYMPRAADEPNQYDLFEYQVRRE